MSNYNYNYNDPNRNKKSDDDWISWALIVALFVFDLGFIALPLLFIKLFLPDRKQRREFIPSLWEKAQGAAASVQKGKAAQDEAAKGSAQDNKVKDAAKKAMRSPAMKTSTSWVLRIVGACLAALGIFALFGPVGELLAYGAESWIIKDILQAATLIIGGGGMFGGGLAMSIAMKRYAKYAAVIGTAEAMSIASIARKTGYSEKRTAKDLQKMMDKGFFGDSAYINAELGYFFRSGEADAELTAQRAAAMRKTEEARSRDKAVGYEAIIAGIRNANDRIADPVLSEKIYRLEDITSKIFEAVEADPKKRARIDNFLNYYLPTTQKLLDSYAQFEATGVNGENMGEAKARIEATMDSIVAGFERQLDELYKTDVMDLDSDISVMETMLKRDNSSVMDDFGLGKKSAAPKDVDLGGSAAQEK